MKLLLPLTGQTVMLEGIGTSDLLGDALQPPTTEEHHRNVEFQDESADHYYDDDNTSKSDSCSCSNEIPMKLPCRQRCCFKCLSWRNLIWVCAAMILLSGAILLTAGVLRSKSKKSSSPPSGFSNADTPSNGGDSKTTFFVMAGRFDLEDEDDMQMWKSRLNSFPTSNDSFVVHLGNWNSRCDSISYRRAASSFQQSSVPMHFLIGDQDNEDCPDSERARTIWYDQFLAFASRFWNQSTPPVSRQDPDHPENFGFVTSKGMLMIGLNVVTNALDGQDKFRDELSSSLLWLDEMYTEHAQASSVVLFLNASTQSKNRNLFVEALFGRIRRYESRAQFLIVQCDCGEYIDDPWPRLQTNFRDISNIAVATIHSDAWPPMRIEITETKTSADEADKSVQIEVVDDEENRMRG